MEIAPDVVSFIEVLVLDTSALFTNVIERKFDIHVFISVTKYGCLRQALTSKIPQG